MFRATRLLSCSARSIKKRIMELKIGRLERLDTSKLAQNIPKLHRTKRLAQHMSVLFCNTQLAHCSCQFNFVYQLNHGTSQYFFVLQSSEITFQYNFVQPNLALSMSENYFVLKKLKRTSFPHKPCTKHVPILLCISKLAQSTFFVRSLQKARPSATLC